MSQKKKRKFNGDLQKAGVEGKKSTKTRSRTKEVQPTRDSQNQEPFHTMRMARGYNSASQDGQQPATTNHKFYGYARQVTVFIDAHVKVPIRFIRETHVHGH